ncbi:MAG TPA: hypothetical protein VLM82_02270, partial [Acidobacteriota bacterium]|nr:hypothetical protein [Acidobacteriota bacterium]
MNLRTKKVYLPLILIVISTTLLVYLPAAYLTENSNSDEVLLFLEEVVRIDVSKYDVTMLGTSMTYPDWLDGLPQMTGKYTLESETSKLDVLFKFRNGTLSWCLMRVIEGSPYYLDVQSEIIREAADDFLERYQGYLGDSELEAMRNILDGEVADNSTTIVGNLKLTMSVTLFSSYFGWRYTFGGTDCGGVDVSFHNGH